MSLTIAQMPPLCTCAYVRTCANASHLHPAASIPYARLIFALHIHCAAASLRNVYHGSAIPLPLPPPPAARRPLCHRTPPPHQSPIPSHPPSLPDNTTAGHPIIFTRTHTHWCAAVHPALCWQGMPERCERARARQDVLFFFLFFSFSPAVIIQSAPETAEAGSIKWRSGNHANEGEGREKK